MALLVHSWTSFCVLSFSCIDFSIPIFKTFIAKLFTHAFEALTNADQINNSLTVLRIAQPFFHLFTDIAV